MNIRLQHGGPGLRILLAAAVGLSLGAGLLVYTRTEVYSLSYRLSALVSREAQLRGRVEKLRLEAAALAAPGRLESEARALGLTYPDPGQIVLLDSVDVASGVPE